jgi:hypothetical protein
MRHDIAHLKHQRVVGPVGRLAPCQKFLLIRITGSFRMLHGLTPLYLLLTTLITGKMFL